MYPTWNTYTHSFAATVEIAKSIMTFMALIYFCFGHTITAFLYPMLLLLRGMLYIYSLSGTHSFSQAGYC